MNWPRVKTILIILFLCINIFLLVDRLILIDRTITIDAETVADTIEILKKNNVLIDKAIIPLKMSSMRKLEMQNPFPVPESLAQSILGNDYEQAFSDETYHFLKDTKTLTIQGCKFAYVNHSPDERITNLNENTLEENVRDILKKFNMDNEYARIKNVVKQDNQHYLVTIGQEYKGKDIYGCYITMNIASEGLYSMEGYWLIPDSFIHESFPVRIITGILIDFADDMKLRNEKQVTITDISTGYYVDTDMVSAKLKTVEAKPVWRISTDDGSFYLYDTINGELINGED